MTRYSIEPRTRKYIKGYGFLSLARKYKKILDTGLDPLKTASKKVVHKTDELFRNKLANAVNKSNFDKTMKQVHFEEILILPEKREEILNDRTIIIKSEHCKISKLLNDIPVSKFVTKNGSK